MKEVKGYIILNRYRDDYDFNDYEVGGTYYHPEGFFFFYSAKCLIEDFEEYYEDDAHCPYKYDDAIVEIIAYLNPEQEKYILTDKGYAWADKIQIVTDNNLTVGCYMFLYKLSGELDSFSPDMVMHIKKDKPLEFLDFKVGMTIRTTFLTESIGEETTCTIREVDNEWIRFTIDNRKDGILYTIHKWLLDESSPWLEITGPKESEEITKLSKDFIDTFY